MKSRFVLVMVALIATACAQTSVRNAWKAPDDPGPAFRKVMVVGVTNRADVRRTFEDSFVAELKAVGVDAVPSYASEPELGPDAKEKLRAAVAKAGVDGVLVTRLVRREKQTQVMPGALPPAGGVGVNMYGYYPSVWAGYYEPATAVQVETVTAEVNLFRTSTEKLAWAGTSETFAPSDIAKSTRDFAKVIISTLSKDKLL